MLKCCKCEKSLPTDMFSKKNTKRGYSHKCKDCHNTYVREVWYKNNKQKQIESSNKWKKKNPVKFAKQRLGLTDTGNLENEIHTDICTICGEVGKMVIDHCHNTGKYRGMLCLKCNSGLGMFSDNVKILQNAIEYLQK